MIEPIPEALSRSLPEASDVEKRILSSMIQYPEEYILRAKDMELRPEHFYKPSHEFLYSTLLDMFERKKPIEILMLTDALREGNQLDNIGGVAELTDIATCETLHANFNAYLNLVQEKFSLRNVIKFYTKRLNEAYQNPNDAESFLEKCNKTGEDFRIGFAEDNRPETSYEVVIRVADAMEFAISNPSSVLVPTPWEGLNKFLGGGYKKGDIHVIAANPSAGKTSHLVTLAKFLGEAKEPICIMTNESDTLELMQRMIANHSSIPTNVIMNGRWYGRKLNEEERGQITQAVKHIKELPIHWHFFKKATRLEMDKIVRNMVKDGVKTFFIDYLQNFQPATSDEAKSGFKKAVVDPVMETIKELKRTYGATFFVYAQLKQDALSKKIDQLNPSFVKDSGNVMQDADTLSFLLIGLENEGDDIDAPHGTPKMRRLYQFKGRNTGSNEYVDFQLDGKYARLEYLQPN